MRKMWCAFGFGLGIISLFSSQAAASCRNGFIAFTPAIDSITRALSLARAELDPETASSQGFREFDRRAFPLRDDWEAAEHRFLEEWLPRLSMLRIQETDEERAID